MSLFELIDDYLVWNQRFLRKDIHFCLRSNLNLEYWLSQPIIAQNASIIWWSHSYFRRLLQNSSWFPNFVGVHILMYRLIIVCSKPKWWPGEFNSKFMGEVQIWNFHERGTLSMTLELLSTLFYFSVIFMELKWVSKSFYFIFGTSMVWISDNNRSRQHIKSETIQWYWIVSRGVFDICGYVHWYDLHMDQCTVYPTLK